MFLQLNPWFGDERPVRVLLLLGWLNGGRAERVANDLQGGGLDICTGLLLHGSAAPCRPLSRPCRARTAAFPKLVRTLVSRDGASAIFYRPDRFLLSVALGALVFRSMIREIDPDLVVGICKGPNVLTYLALRGMGEKRPRWIAREGNNIVRSADEVGRDKARRGIEHALVRNTYRAADRVLANFKRLAVSLAGTFELPSEKLRMVHNPVDLETIRGRVAETAQAAPPRPLIVSVGRLVAQKGHDILLRALAGSGYRDSHHLVIVGEGPAEQSLLALAGELGNAGRVHLLGFPANPWALVARAEFLVLASRCEGFANALLEALACGTPVVATDCYFGSGELIERERSGWLVPADDHVALSRALDTLLAAPDLRRRLGVDAFRRPGESRSEVILPQFEARIQKRVALAPRRVGLDAAMRPERTNEWSRNARVTSG
jgi:N-acetylgalactosamine-N,N'-diacetylbacillosaminyl-diphospho-undecaprenol 4-alpha-N-acetylgalactosaminyltransferase